MRRLRSKTSQKLLEKILLILSFVHFHNCIYNKVFIMSSCKWSANRWANRKESMEHHKKTNSSERLDCLDALDRGLSVDPVEQWQYWQKSGWELWVANQSWVCQATLALSGQHWGYLLTGEERWYSLCEREWWQTQILLIIPHSLNLLSTFRTCAMSCLCPHNFHCLPFSSILASFMPPHISSSLP